MVSTLAAMVSEVARRARGPCSTSVATSGSAARHRHASAASGGRRGAVPSPRPSSSGGAFASAVPSRC
eukprot:158664-Pleurochrysis_carterae.AAC.1